MTVIWVVLATLLPAAFGGAVLALLSARPRGPADWVWLGAAGWLLAMLSIGAILPLLPIAPSSALAWLAPMLAGPAVLLSVLARRRWASAADAAGGDVSMDSGFRRSRWLPLLALALAIQFVLILHQALWMPSYPWDAWTVWLLRARAWLEADAFLPLLGLQEWWAAQGPALPTIAPDYPNAVPGIAVWFGSAAGGWNSAAVHAAWPLAWLAGALAMWSGLLRAGVGSRVAELGSFAWASLPMLSAHVALAGYADLWVGLLLMLAGLSALQLGQTAQRRGALLVLALSILLLPTVKLEGWVWAGVALSILSFALLPRRGRRIAVALLAAGALLVLLLLVLWPLQLTLPGLGELRIGSGALVLGPIKAQFHPQNVLPELLWTLFVLPHWHLLWLLLPVLLALGWRCGARLNGLPAGAAGLALGALLGLVFLVLVFGFSQHAQWLRDLTSINRLLLHWLPLPLLLAAWLWRESGVPGAVPAKDDEASA